MTLPLTFRNPQEAFVTLVTSNPYVAGALVLGYSLRKVGATRRLICMITSNVSADLQAKLREIYELRFVDSLNSGDSRNLQLLGRPDLGVTFTKIHIWTFTDLTKAVFLDADVMILKNIDDLFEREEFSACADVGWPDCFNSGVFVCQPSMTTYEAIRKLAFEEGSFDGGDQGLLNAFFKDWSSGSPDRRIPFVYNLTFNACYSYLPAFEKFKDQVRAVHFIGRNKPWNFFRFSDGQVSVRGDGSTVHVHYVQLWWDLYDEFAKQLDKGCRKEDTGYAKTSAGTPGEIASDFANYRVKWTADVESFFKKSELRKAPSRKLGYVGNDDDKTTFNDSITRKSSQNNLGR